MPFLLSKLEKVRRLLGEAPGVVMSLEAGAWDGHSGSVPCKLAVSAGDVSFDVDFRLSVWLNGSSRGVNAHFPYRTGEKAWDVSDDEVLISLLAEWVQGRLKSFGAYGEKGSPYDR